MQVYESTLDTIQGKSSNRSNQARAREHQNRHDENGDLLNQDSDGDNSHEATKPVFQKAAKNNSKFLDDLEDEDEDSEDNLNEKYRKQKLQDSD